MITNQQLYMLAVQTGQWYNAVLIQWGRFFNAFNMIHGQLPWDDEPNTFLAEKMFLITAIHHAIQHLEKLNEELEERGDFSFQPFLATIATKEERNRIKKWRNMNEHGMEYLIGEGRFPGENISTVEKGEHKFKIDAATTFVHGGIGVFMIGSIEIDKLTLRFKDNQSEILKKLEEIFNRALAADVNEVQQMPGDALYLHNC